MVWTLGDSTAQALGQLLENDLADGPGGRRPAPSTRTRPGSPGRTSTTGPPRSPPTWRRAHPTSSCSRWATTTPRRSSPLGSGTFVDVGEPGWLEEYQRRLTGFVDQLTAAGSRVYLVGQPVIRDPTFDARIAVVDQAYRNVAAADPEVTYISSRALLGDEPGRLHRHASRAPAGRPVTGAQQRRDPPLPRGRPLAGAGRRAVGSLADYGVQGP